MTDLSQLSAAEIDARPFGYIGLTPEGTVRKYNRYEADLARRDPQTVLGRNFFREVAPCTQVQEFEGRFRDFAAGRIAEPTLSFEFTFAFRHGEQRVRIGMVRSPLQDEIILTVNRIHDRAVAFSSELKADLPRRTLADAAGRRVLVLDADFFQALDAALGGRAAEARDAALHRAGVEWGLHHALRVEAAIQRNQAVTLREAEFHVALEYLSGSLGVVGLGRFDVDLALRRRGLMSVTHHDSPFAAWGGEPGSRNCALLAGLHAGLLSHLAGRRLAGRETSCGVLRDQPCRLVVGTETRLGRLFDPSEGSTDADLLVALGVRPLAAAS
jgi:photoactive yellow protein